jgi:hypothetical protein
MSLNIGSNVKTLKSIDRIPVFKYSLDENSIDELLISLGAVNPQNTNIVTVNKIVNDCNNIIKSAALGCT